MGLSRFGLVVSAVCLSMSVASGASFSFQGTFTQDDQIEIFLFTAPSANAVVRTWGYAGGTNANTVLVPAGGFDPILSIFDATAGLSSASLLLGTNDTGVTCPTGAPNCVSPDPATTSAFDSLILVGGLNPGGTYALILSQADNSPFGPDYGGGFSQSGQPNFTATEFPCGGTAFCDSNLTQRNGNWAVDITGVRSASDVTNGSAPEPGSVALIGTGLAGVLLRRRYWKRH